MRAVTFSFTFLGHSQYLIESWIVWKLPVLDIFAPYKSEIQHHDASLPLDRALFDRRTEGIGRSHAIVSNHVFVLALLDQPLTLPAQLRTMR